MSWLSAAWDRNKKALVTYGVAFAAGGPAGLGAAVTKDAIGEAKRVVARTNAPPEAQAVMLANATNAVNAAAAAAGVSAPPGPLGAQGQQVVAIGGKTVSVNTIALVGLGLVLLLVVFLVARKKR